jgi:hypothetical protein
MSRARNWGQSARTAVCETALLKILLKTNLTTSGLVCIPNRATMLVGLARWGEKGGSYRTARHGVRRFFLGLAQKVIPSLFFMVP